MKTSYKERDVIVLLKDITGKLQALSLSEREKRRQQGVHYSEMLPLEYQFSTDYLKLYQQILSKYSKKTAYAVSQLADKIISQKGKDVTLVSLARAGTPVGILLKRYILKKYNIDAPHYTISIILKRGIDHNAMKYILGKHKSETIQFIDGWTGKGSILKELQKSLILYPNISTNLAVLADPAHLTSLYGTQEDFLLPSACLGSTVSGLFSRTVLNNDVISENDFHGAAYFEYLEDKDVSYEFIESIEKHFDNPEPIEKSSNNINTTINGSQEVKDILQALGISKTGIIKPGIGEATRSLLRNSPNKILVKNINDIQYIEAILQLAKEKQVPIEEYPLRNYRACGILERAEAHI